jgi:response regulator RpfG family c-di-GMP phosphodiesterase
MNQHPKKASYQRIFCVDGNPYFRRFMSWSLTSNGCEVSQAATAREALRLLQQKPTRYDLLIVAHSLPDMNSIELLQTLHSIGYTGRIVVTARRLHQEEGATYKSLGASSILITPVGYSDILRILVPPNTALSGAHRLDQCGKSRPSCPP